MSDETRMNSELKKLEASLSSLPLPSSALQSGTARDELMYQAGWAAAMASLNADMSSNAVSKSSSPQQHFFARQTWPVLTAVATTAAILFATLFFMDTNNNRATGVANLTNVEESSNSKDDPANLNDADNLIQPATAEARQDLVALILDMPAGQTLSSGLAFQRFDEAVETDDISQPPRSRSIHSHQPKTQEQLMDELLPQRDQTPRKTRRGFSFFPNSNT